MGFDFSLFANILFTNENSKDGFGVWVKHLKPLLLYADTVNVYLNYEFATGSKVSGKEGLLEIQNLEESGLIKLQALRFCSQGSKHSRSLSNDNKYLDNIGTTFPVFAGNTYNEHANRNSIHVQNLKVGQLFNDLAIKLPNLINIPINEILDIKKDLEKPLVNFRKKKLKCSETVQAMPFEQGFYEECHRLYYTEIAPAMLEIEELLKENSFVKNLGAKLFSDESFLKAQAVSFLVYLL